MEREQPGGKLWSCERVAFDSWRMFGLELPVVTKQAAWGDEGCSDKRRSN